MDKATAETISEAQRQRSDAHVKEMLGKDLRNLPREQIFMMALLNRGVAVLERIAAVMEKTEERVARQSGKMEQMISERERAVSDNN